MIDHGVILLNADFIFIDLISWKKAYNLISRVDDYNNKSKVEVLEYTEIEVCPGYYLPKVIKLYKLIRRFYGTNIYWTPFHLKVRDGFRCQYCGKRLSQRHLTVDHVIPRSRGGKTIWENTVSCCLKCNQRKKSFLPSEIKMSFFYKKPVKPTVHEFFKERVKLFGIEETLKQIGGWF